MSGRVAILLCGGGRGVREKENWRIIYLKEALRFRREVGDGHGKKIYVGEY